MSIPMDELVTVKELQDTIAEAIAAMEGSISAIKMLRESAERAEKERDAALVLMWRFVKSTDSDIGDVHRDAREFLARRKQDETARD